MIDHSGRFHDFGTAGTGPSATVRLHDPALYRRLALYPTLHVGRAYVDGTLTVEEGTLSDFLDLVLINEQLAAKGRAGDIKRRLDQATRLAAVVNLPGRSRRNVHHHYDHAADFYRCFLDEDMQYSCAYFAAEGVSLEEAQEAKKRHIAAKLLVEHGHRVLDIGCGWGGLGLYLARSCGARVTGITLSQEQLGIACTRPREEGLSGTAHFRLQDYRAITEQFDRIVSVGMFEHVGVGYYDTFFRKAREHLAEDGVMLLHSIGRMDGPGAANPWIDKYIFPGGYAPALSEVLPAIERAGLIVTDIEILRVHYADTLKAWRERFLAQRDQAKALYDERFCRMWEYYLASCEVAFRYCGLMVFQIQLAKSLQAVPLTRDYIVTREAELKSNEAQRPGLMVAAE